MLGPLDRPGTKDLSQRWAWAVRVQRMFGDAVIVGLQSDTGTEAALFSETLLYCCHVLSRLLLKFPGPFVHEL